MNMKTYARAKRYDAIADGKSKRCTVCNKTKALEEFHKNSNTKDGHKGTCAVCSVQRDREHYYEDPEANMRAKERAKKFYQENRERTKYEASLRQLKLKIKALEYLERVCSECGEDHPAALQFHHIDPSTKEFSVSTKTLSSVKKYPWDVVTQELDKCVILCGNCHAKHHTQWSDEMIDKAIEEINA